MYPVGTLEAEHFRLSELSSAQADLQQHPIPKTRQNINVNISCPGSFLDSFL